VADEERERAYNAGFVTASRMHGAEIERLRALASAPRVPQWQPIETAPTGRIHSPPLRAIVASMLDSGEFYVEEAWFDNERLQWWPANVDSSDAHGAAIYPAHWMPLPAAPQPEGGQS
jgi:hypothetical protein